MTAKRTATHAHSWRNGRCAWCGMRPEWPGGRRPCEAIYAAHRARSEAKHKAIANALRILSGRNEEGPLRQQRALGNTNSEGTS